MKKGKPTYTTVQWDSLDDPDKFRDADRIEEAQRIPLTESQKAQAELEPIEKGVCVTGELRKARENDRIKATRRIRGRSTTDDPGNQKGN